MKHIVTFATFAVCMLPATQLTSEITNEAEAVIQAFNEATGGLEEKLKIKNWVQMCRIKMLDRDVDEQLTYYQERPNKLATILDLPGGGRSHVGFNGEVGWDNSDRTGFVLIEGSELVKLAKDSVMFPETDIAKHYKIAERLEDRDDGTIVISLIDFDDHEEKWSFDPLSHLLVKKELMIDAGEDKIVPVVTKLSSYRKAGNVLVPFKQVTTNPAFGLILMIDSIQVNTEIPESIFEHPSIRK